MTWQQIPKIGQREAFRLLFLVQKTTKILTRVWAVSSAILIFSTIWKELLPKCLPDAASMTRSLRWSITGTTLVSIQRAPTWLMNHSKTLCLSRLKLLMTKARNSLSLLSLLTSSGKTKVSIKMQPIKRVKRVPSWKCLAGLTKMLKLNVKLWVKWAGWASKSFHLKNPCFQTNGHKVENLIHGTGITNQCLTTCTAAVEPGRSYVAWFKLADLTELEFMLTQSLTTWPVVLMINLITETVTVIGALLGLAKTVKTTLTFQLITGHTSLIKTLDWFQGVNIHLRRIKLLISTVKDLFLRGMIPSSWTMVGCLDLLT